MKRCLQKAPLHKPSFIVWVEQWGDILSLYTEHSVQTQTGKKKKPQGRAGQQLTRHLDMFLLKPLKSQKYCKAVVI